MSRDFGQPYRRLDCFNLTEERAETAEGVVSPVLKETGRLWCDLPQIVWQLAPLINLLTKFIYDRRRIVLLLFCRKPFPFIEDNLLLSG